MEPGSPPPGWYPDPGGGESRRYWDGSTWTDRLEDSAPTPEADVPAGPARYGPAVAFAVVVSVVLAAVGAMAPTPAVVTATNYWLLSTVTAATLGSLMVVPYLVTDRRRHFSPSRGWVAVVLTALVYVTSWVTLAAYPEKYGVQLKSGSPVVAILLVLVYRSASRPRAGQSAG